MPRKYTTILFVFIAFSVPAFCGSPKSTTRHPLVQTADNIASYDSRVTNPLFGLSAMVAEALPPVNSDGTANQARQNTAVNLAVDSLVRNNLIAPATSTITVDDMKYFARSLTMSMNGYKDIRVQSPMLVWLKTLVQSNTDTSGNVNWTNCTATTTCVQGDVNDLVSIAITTGQVKLDPGVTADQLKAFAFGLAQAVDAYNRAGY